MCEPLEFQNFDRKLVEAVSGKRKASDDVCALREKMTERSRSGHKGGPLFRSSGIGVWCRARSEVRRIRRNRVCMRGGRRRIGKGVIRRRRGIAAASETERRASSASRESRGGAEEATGQAKNKSAVSSVFGREGLGVELFSGGVATVWMK